MKTRVCALLVWLLMATTVASCGLAGEGSRTRRATLTPTGELPKQPPSGTPEALAALSACRGRIAFVGRTDGEKDIYVVSADGSGLFNVTNGAGPLESPSWSPEGDRIVFTRYVGNPDVYIINPDGSGLLRLTDHPGRDYAPAWSPDGHHVLFASTRGSMSEVFVVSAEGGEAVPLTGSGAHKTELAWSPDGSRIVFTMLTGYNQGDIFVMAAPDEAGADESTFQGTLTNLTQHPAHDCCAAWSPDGERILFLSSRDGESAGRSSEDHWDGGQAGASIVRVGQRSEMAVSDFVNRKQASSGDVRLVTTVVPERPRDIYVVDSHGSGLTRLTNGAGHEKHAIWSPDGTRIAFVSDRDGNDELYVMAAPDRTDPGGGEVVRLTDSPEDDWRPAWSPDGTCLAFVSYHNGVSRLYTVNADGSGLLEVAENADWSSAPTWSP